MRSFTRLARAVSATLFLGACGATLTPQQAALVDDSVDDGNQADDVEVGLEQALSGASVDSPDALDPASDPMTLVKTNPGYFFKPAGCITTTVSGMTATHVFNDCTGPFGLVHFTGTVTSTWTVGNGSLTVTNHADGFKINGATVTHDATIVYTKSGTTYERTRKGTTSGTTADGRAFTRTFDNDVTWDPTTRCVTRDGTVDATLAGRSWSGTISNYQRCGVGLGGCPSSGTITLDRTNPAVSLEVDFPGGATMDIKLSNGKTVTKTLACTPQ